MVRAYLMGPMAKGYWLDPFRTAVCGNKPTPEQKRLIEDCGDITEAILAAVRPGVRVKALAKIGDELHRKAGGERDQASLQWPLYGHGNGLFFEGPIFGEEACDDDDVIEENMVGSSECFLARSGIGAAGFEQNYIVTKDGIELITKTPMYYWE